MAGSTAAFHQPPRRESRAAAAALAAAALACAGEDLMFVSGAPVRLQRQEISAPGRRLCEPSASSPGVSARLSPPLKRGLLRAPLAVLALGAASSKLRRRSRLTRAAFLGEDAAASSRRGFLAAATSAVTSVGTAPPAFAERLGLSAEALSRARGKVVVITGATSGVGLEAARTLLAAGSDVYVTGRSLKKAQAAADAIAATAAAGARVIPLELDLASFKSVRNFAETWKKDVRRPIDLLCCNAGLALGQGDEEPKRTEDGFELTVGTNHLGHFLLVDLLQEELSANARVVVTASSVHDPAAGDPGAQASLGDLSGLASKAAMVDGSPYNAAKAYKDSKLCNVLFTLELARRLKSKGSKVTANCFSPGLIPSPTFFRNQNEGFAKAFAWLTTNVIRISETPEFGGDALVFMGLDPSLDGRSGNFYSAIPPGRHTFVEKTVSPEAASEAEAAALWAKSAALVGCERKQPMCAV